MGHRPLEGQKALVTGASSGIGEGVARALGAAGGTDGSIGSAQCGREGLAQGVRCLDVVPAVGRERLVA